MNTVPVYLDNNATTRIAPRALEAMMPYLTDVYANPSSVHRLGHQAAAAVEHAREQVAAMLGARPSEIIFTSGGTESNNAALYGLAAARPAKRHIVATAVEHHALLEPLARLEREGYRVTRLAVDAGGQIDLDELRDALCDDTLLVSAMLANNETGAILPVAEIARVAAERDVFVHTDAVSAAGKLAIDAEQLGVALLSLSAHKFHGPKGAGALYLRRGTPWRPLIVGGAQERDRRGGTQNVPGIIGMGVACELVGAAMAQDAERVRARRDRLAAGITERCPGARIIAADAPRLPNTACVCFPGIEAEALLILLSEAGICVSSGAACSSGSLEPSHVLAAMGIDPAMAHGQIRFSLSHLTTDAEIDHVLDTLPDLLARISTVSTEGTAR